MSCNPGRPSPSARPRPGWGRFLPFAGLAVLAAAFWWFRIIGPARIHAYLLSDLFNYVYPMSSAAASAWLSGSAPLWNPFQSCGYPLLATSAAGMLYPLNAPYLFLPAHVALEMTVVTHLIAAGSFTFVYARAIGLAGAPACLAGVTFMLSGFVAWQGMWFPPALAACVWIPLGFLAVDGAVERSSPRWAVLFALVVAMPILAGWLQVWLYTMYAVGAYAATRVADHGVRRDGRAATHAAGILAAGGLLGLGVAAAQILPSLELQRLGPRRPGGLSLEQALRFGTPDLADLVAPALNASSSTPHPAYLGIVPLVVLPLSWLVARRRLQMACLWLLAILCLAVAATVHTPIFGVFWMLPGADWFRAPQRIIFVSAFAGAVLGAMGLQVVAELGSHGRARRLAVVTLATLSGVAWIVLGRTSTTATVYVLLAVAGVWAAAFAGSRVLRRAAVVGLVVLATWDVFHAHENIRFRPFHEPGAFDVGGEVLRFLRTEQGLHRTYFHSMTTEPAWMHKQGTLRGIYALTDYEPLSLGRQARFFRLLQARPPSEEAAASDDGTLFFGSVSTRPAAPHFELINLASVRFMVVHEGEYILRNELTAAGWREVMASSSGPAVVYENGDPMPRAYVVEEAVFVANEEAALSALTAPSFDFRQRVVLEAAGGSGARPGAEGPAFTPARVVRHRPRVVDVEVETARGGYLVLTDTFYPGWRATVDGEAVRLLRANALFRAVRLEPGSHRVSFTYHPSSVRLGGALSLVAVLVLVILLVYPWRAGARRNAFV